MQPNPTRRLAILILLSFALAGCQTLGSARMITSSVTAELTPEAANSIAGDLVGRLAEQIGPGSNTIRLQSDGSLFGQAIEQSLKGWGYAVVTDQKTEGGAIVPLAYVIDSFEGSVLARLSTPSLDLTRMYQLGPTGATPTSPLSVMQRGTGQT